MMHRLDIVYATFLSFLCKDCRFTPNGLLQAQEVGVCWCGDELYPFDMQQCMQQCIGKRP